MTDNLGQMRHRAETIEGGYISIHRDHPDNTLALWAAEDDSTGAGVVLGAREATSLGAAILVQARRSAPFETPTRRPQPIPTWHTEWAYNLDTTKENGGWVNVGEVRRVGSVSLYVADEVKRWHAWATLASEDAFRFGAELVAEARHADAAEE
jgi:hypothetical protein